MQNELKQVVLIMDEKVREALDEKQAKINEIEEEIKDLKQLVDTGIMN